MEKVRQGGNRVTHDDLENGPSVHVTQQNTTHTATVQLPSKKICVSQTDVTLSQ